FQCNDHQPHGPDFSFGLPLEQQTSAIRPDRSPHGHDELILVVFDGNIKPAIAFFADDGHEPGRIDRNIVFSVKNEHAKNRDAEKEDRKFHDFENFSIIIVEG
ncbi:MAG: hypothetical protein IJH79_11225, partial [Lentisphaeria bacterium]|nr:hypothetical protein [Lentisphaeria bacterium]